jgi:hypothetical protein
MTIRRELYFAHETFFMASLVLVTIYSALNYTHTMLCTVYFVREIEPERFK